jgi:hypothetical protein
MADEVGRRVPLKQNGNEYREEVVVVVVVVEEPERIRPY